MNVPLHSRALFGLEIRLAIIRGTKTQVEFIHGLSDIIRLLKTKI